MRKPWISAAHSEHSAYQPGRLELSFVATVLFALPSLAIVRLHYAGAALLLAAVILILGLSALAMPERREFAGAIAATTRQWSVSFRI